MLTIVILSDDERELNECLASLWQIAKIPRKVEIIDLNKSNYGKGKVFLLNRAISSATTEYILCMDCRCRIEQKELESMLLATETADLISPAFVNRNTTKGVNPDFFLFKKDKSPFPLDDRLISYHYEKLIDHEHKIANVGRIIKLKNITRYTKKYSSREDYRYKTDLHTYERIQQEW